MAKLPTSKKIFDVRGEGQTNPDGSSRQNELLACEPGEPVTLVREPQNSYDPNAVAVRSARGVVIGYLAREDAAVLAPAFDNGRPHRAKLHKITGGVSYAPDYGAKVSIAWADRPAHPHEELYDEQIASRRGKQGIKGRGRDASGRLVATEKSGCSMVLLAGFFAGGSLVALSSIF